MTAQVRLTEQQREELAQALGRLVVLLARWLHLPWWAALLLLAAAASGLLGLTLAQDRLLRRARARQCAEARRAQAMHLTTTPADGERAVCGHCGRPTASSARINGIRLCRTGTWPASAEPRDCYRLVTEHRHHADGSCCRRDGA